MAIDISQYDWAVIESAEDILQANLAAVIATVNTEVGGKIVLVDPEDAQKAGRSDSKLNEKSLPQALAGFWVRITESNEILGVGGVSGSGGQSRTIHKMEVLTYILVQNYEASALQPTTQTTGYKTAMLLARSGTLAIQQNITCTAGVYNILRVPSQKIPSAITKLPYVHMIRDTFEVYQKTRR